MRRRILKSTPRTTAISTYGTISIARAIDTMEQRYMEIMVDRPFTVGDAIGAMFSEDTLNRLRAAAGLTYYSTTSARYDSVPLPVGVRATFWIEFGSVAILPPAEEAVVFQLSCAPLMLCLAEMLAVQRKFQEVRDVFAFLDKGTAGAMRGIWPTVLSLLPAGGESEKLGVRERYKTPDNLGPWITNIRSASATVATALMLPDATATPDQRALAHPCITAKFVYDVREPIDLLPGHVTTEIFPVV